jgi:hypothetical protein
LPSWRASSPTPRAKAALRKTQDGNPVHSFRTLLQGLGTLTRNTVRLGDAPPAIMLAKPTGLQQDTSWQNSALFFNRCELKR